MSINKLTLTPVVDVIVNLGLKTAARKGFNLGLIIGSSTVIPTAERVRIYTGLDAMITDGFKATDAEYKAAQLYFSASTAPDRLAVGVKGTDETILVAAQACRKVNSEWYPFVPLGAAADDIKTLAEWTETATPSTVLMYTTAANDVLDSTGAATDIFLALKTKNYRRSFGLFCGQADTPDAVAAVMGYAMGANTGLAASSYTLAYKNLKGVTPDDLSEAQIAYICGTSSSTGSNGNVYICRAEDYNVLQQGYMADKTSFDEILNLDMLKNSITLNVMDLLYSLKKIPQTEAGVAAIVNVINVACNEFVTNGFIAPGQWNGPKCLDLKTGDFLANGYLVQSAAVNEQTQANRDARKAPPIYVCVKLAGAIEFVTIEVNVNR